MKKLLVVALAILGGIAAFAAEPNIWWVAKEDKNASDELVTGRGTEALPFRTIQAALDNPDFVAGDNVYVKRGRYDEGGKANAASDKFSLTNRVYISKKVHLKAVDGKYATSIVGKWGSGSYGAGKEAFRCVYVKSDAVGTVIENFTLEQGAAMWKNDGGAYDTREGSNGPGLYVAGKAQGVYLVDCKVYNCSGNFSGAMYGGTAIRCVFDLCKGTRGANILVGSYAFACAITRSKSNGSEYYQLDKDSIAVNCSFVVNGGKTIGTTGAAYNCIMAANAASDVAEGATALDCYQSTVATNVAFATGFDDYRLFSDSPALEVAGDPAHRQVLIDKGVPEEYLAKDLRGDLIDWEASSVRVGAVQSTATPAISTTVFSTTTVVDGYVVKPNQWICAEAFPTTFELAPYDKTKAFFGFSHTHGGSGKQPLPSYDYLQSGGFVRVIPPKRSDYLQVTYTPNYAAAELWVDPSSAGSDEDGDGSFEKPFETLQKAVDSVTASTTLIHARRGDYRKGGKAHDGLMARVSFQGCDKAILLRAEEGPDVTTIWGAADPETAEDATLPGCGTNAVRCVCTPTGNFVVQGFTLRDGHTFAKTEGTVATGNMVLDGAAMGTTSDSWWGVAPTVLDCVITNCVSAMSLFRNVFTCRCRVVGNLSHGCIFNNHFAASSLIANNRCAGFFGYTSNGGGWGWMNTCWNNTLAPGVSSFNNWEKNYYIYGTIVVGGAVRTTSGGDIGNVVWDQATTSNLKATSVVGDPILADPADGDFRPSFGGAAGNVVAAASLSSFYLCVGSDLNGEPIRASADGRLTAGCVQANLPYAIVVAGAKDAGLLVNGQSGAALTNVLERDESIEVTLSGDATTPRWAKGYTLNGVEHLFDAYPGVSEKMTFAFSESGYRIDPILSTEWYVDATNGDDARGGFTAATAKKTLAEVFTNCAVTAGDTVYALPGTYDVGVMRQSEDTRVWSRAVVPEGVTLAATGSAEETIIRGADSPEPVNTYGQGPDAVRCLYTEKNSTIRGLTLTGGRTQKYGDVTAAAEVDGGGILSANDTVLVCDCIISNNVAGYGGGTYNGKVVKCKLFDNTATKDGYGAAGYNGYYYGCLVDGNDGQHTIMYPSGVYSCTIGYNKGGRGVYFYSPSAKSFRVFNSILYKTANNQSVNWNCLIYTNFTGSYRISAEKLEEGQCRGFASYEDFKLDESLRPLKDSPAVDMGDGEKRGSYFPETDLAGVPRVLNDGRFDIGAFEYDWRVDYSKDLGGHVKVTDVSSNVVETADGKVEVPEGFLKLDWPSKGKPLVFNAQVAGEGLLAVNVNGEPFATVTETDEPVEFRIPESLDLMKFEFVFTGSGSATLADFRREGGALLIVR